MDSRVYTAPVRSGGAYVWASNETAAGVSWTCWVSTAGYAHVDVGKSGDRGMVRAAVDIERRRVVFQRLTSRFNVNVDVCVHGRFRIPEEAALDWLLIEEGSPGSRLCISPVDRVYNCPSRDHCAGASSSNSTNAG